MGKKENMKFKRISVPFRNVKSTKGEIKIYGQSHRAFKQHRGETHYYGDAKKRVVTLNRDTGNSFNERHYLR